MNYKEKIDDVKKVAKKNLKSLLMDFAVAGVSIIYVFYNALQLEPTSENIIKLSVRGVIGLVVGLVIKTCLGENGFTKGYNSDKYQEEEKEYNKQCEPAYPYVDKVDEFYEKERKEKLKKKRQAMLSSYRMKYDFYFDDNGDYIEHEIIRRKEFIKKKEKTRKTGENYHLNENEIVLDDEQIKVLNKAIKVKVYISSLFREYQTSLIEDERPEVSDNEKRRANLSKNVLSALAITLAGVYFVPSWTWNWGYIIQSLFQVISWIAFGVIQLYDNYNWIVHDKVETMQKKKSRIIKFLKMCYEEEKNGRDDFINKFNLVKPNDPPKAEEKQTEFIEVEMTEEELKKYKGAIN